MEKVVWVLTMIFRALCKILCVAYVIFSVFVGFLYYYYFFLPKHIRWEIRAA